LIVALSHRECRATDTILVSFIHVSGLFARRERPLAMMVSVDRVLIKIARLAGALNQPGLSDPRLDRVASALSFPPAQTGCLARQAETGTRR
jgi:hypothetical protein